MRLARRTGRCDMPGLRLRRWAREHYVPRNHRQISWHPIVHEEMERKDEETGEGQATPDYAWAER